MIHDTVALERKGIPTLAISHDRFEAAARGQAEVLGLKDVALLVVPQPRPGEGPEAQRRSAEVVFDEAIRALVRPAPRPA